MTKVLGTAAATEQLGCPESSPQGRLSALRTDAVHARCPGRPCAGYAAGRGHTTH